MVLYHLGLHSRHWLASRRGVYYKNHPDDYTALPRLGCIAAIRLDGSDTCICWEMAMEEVYAVQKNITITHDNTSRCSLPKEGPRFGKLARETCDKSSRQLIVIITTIITATTIVFITIMEINGNYNPSTCAKMDALKGERAIKSPISLAHLSPKWLSRLVTPSSAALPQVP